MLCHEDLTLHHHARMSLTILTAAPMLKAARTTQPHQSENPENLILLCPMRLLSSAMANNDRNRIVVPERAVNGGFDCKYESDAYNVKLYNIMRSEDYEDAIARVNETVKPSRAKKVDTVLLVTGPLMLPLAVGCVRHSGQVRKWKKLLSVAIQEFNESHPDLLMRYNRQPQSCLTIERRIEGVTHPPNMGVSIPESNNIIVVAEPLHSTSYTN